MAAATYSGAAGSIAFNASTPNGSAATAPATPTRPSRAFARMRPSCFEA